ncbi:MAG: tetratricopeptide repeat protein [Elusimicrobia bacterium]|nr:tetratricopeptide repeat protein [Elusimicrobiota bacterium]
MNVFKPLKAAVLISLATLVLLFLVIKIHGYDVWLHLAAGKYIVNNFKVPFLDPFSYTAVNKFYIDSNWLYQIILYVFYINIGFWGIFIYRLLVIGAVFYILFNLGKKSNFYISTLCIFLTLVIANQRFMIRPEMFSYLFSVLFIMILDKFIIGKDNSKVYARPVYILPVLQVLWTNMHASFVFGPVIIGCYVFGEFLQNRKDFKPLLLTFILCIAVCFVNPYGYRLVFYPLECIAMQYGYKVLFYPYLLFDKIDSHTVSYFKSVSEMMPTFVADTGSFHKSAFAILMIVSCVSFFISKRFSASRFLVYGIFLCIGFLAIRNASYFAFVAAFITIVNFEKIKELQLPVNGKTQKVLGYIYVVFTIVLFFVMAVGIIVNKYYKYEKSIKRFGIGKENILYPSGAIGFIKNSDLKGNIFNDALIGGYFVWECFPERKVFTDGRLQVYGDEFLAEYKNVIDNPGVYWKKVADKYRFTHVLLHPLSPHSKKLIRYLYKSKSWKLSYLDESGVVFTKNDYKVGSIIRKPVLDLHGSENKILEYLSFANFFYETEQYGKAKFFYTEILRLDPDFAEAYINLAGVFMAEGNYGDAKACYKMALQKSKKYAEPFFGLATIYLKEERYTAALQNVNFALRIKPVFPEAQILLGYIYQKSGNFKGAISVYEELISRQPADETVYNALGTAYYLNKNYDEALKKFKKAMEINPDFTEAKKNYRICIDKINERNK